MKALIPPITQFRKRSLAEQLAESLRVAIKSGQYIGSLPTERTLSTTLDASRPVIREALHRLQKEGVVEIRQGQRARILADIAEAASEEREKRVILLFVGAAHVLPAWQLSVIDELRNELFRRGYSFELVLEPGLSRKQPAPLLAKLLEKHRADHWILAGTSAMVQAWFHGKPLNVIIMGNPFPDLHFPFVNDDLRGVSRHGAGVFLGLGHRKILFLMRDNGSAGEVDEEAGFREAFVKTQGVDYQVLKHSGEVEQLRFRLRRAFSPPSKYTAMLVSHAEDTLVVINWFLENGIKLPDEVSLISFQWESFLERLRPLPAWYYTDPVKHARKLCRLILHPSYDKRSPRLLVPVFCRNETCGCPQR